VHAVGDGVRLEQVPELRQLLERALRPRAAESTGRRVEDLAATAKRGKREQQAALGFGGVGPFQRRLDSDEVAARERSQNLFAGSRIESRRVEQPGMKSA